MLTPLIEFSYPLESPTTIVQISHGIQSNVQNRRIIKTVKRTLSAGNEYNFRNIGYTYELFNIAVILATKDEARAITDFFKNVVKGSCNVFYYKNYSINYETNARFMQNNIKIGEVKGHPYSFLLLLKVEPLDVINGKSFTIVWDFLAGGGGGP